MPKGVYERKPLIPAEQRFLAKVDKNGPVPAHRPDLGPCWIWQAARKSKGYGRFSYGGRVRQAHAAAYEMAHGPVPSGFQLDHLCRTPACVRVAHLEAVTSRVNTLRGEGLTARFAKVTHCPKGHPYDLLNTRYKRRKGGLLDRGCRTCERLSKRRSTTKQGGKAVRGRQPKGDGRVLSPSQHTDTTKEPGGLGD